MENSKTADILLVSKKKLNAISEKINESNWSEEEREKAIYTVKTAYYKISQNLTNNNLGKYIKEFNVVCDGITKDLEKLQKSENQSFKKNSGYKEEYEEEECEKERYGLDDETLIDRLNDTRFEHEEDFYISEDDDYELQQAITNSMQDQINYLINSIYESQIEEKSKSELFDRVMNMYDVQDYSEIQKISENFDKKIEIIKDLKQSNIDENVKELLMDKILLNNNNLNSIKSYVGDMIRENEKQNIPVEKDKASNFQSRVSCRLEAKENNFVPFSGEGVKIG